MYVTKVGKYVNGVLQYEIWWYWRRSDNKYFQWKKYPNCESLEAVSHTLEGQSEWAVVANVMEILQSNS